MHFKYPIYYKNKHIASVQQLSKAYILLSDLDAQDVTVDNAKFKRIKNRPWLWCIDSGSVRFLSEYVTIRYTRKGTKICEIIPNDLNVGGVSSFYIREEDVKDE